MVRQRVQIRVVNFDLGFEAGGNVEHLQAHDVQVVDLYDVLERGPLFFRNLEGRSGSHAMIGRAGRGRSLYVTLRATPEPGVWHPVTGWRSRLAHNILQKEGLI